MEPYSVAEAPDEGVETYLQGRQQVNGPTTRSGAEQDAHVTLTS